MVSIIILFGVGLFVVGIGFMIITSLSNKNTKMYCPECKREVDINTTTCPYCGYILK